MQKNEREISIASLDALEYSSFEEDDMSDHEERMRLEEKPLIRSYIDGCIENSQSSVPALRRKAGGRPKIERTGRKGRPRKIYKMVAGSEEEIQEVAEQPVEYANLAEIPLKQAILSPESEEWKVAITEEVKSLIKNDTWELVDKPRNRDVIGCRVVLRNKYHADGRLERRKARIVAKGFTQKPGIDYHDTYSPVARLGSIRLLMALAAEQGMLVHQLDITTAYLNGIIEEEIYMEIPQMLEEALERIVAEEHDEKLIYMKAKKMLEILRNENKVCQLRKALYGLKQAGRQWYKKLDKRLQAIGLKPTVADPCVYHAKRGEDKVLVAIYVDDIIMVSRNLRWITELKQKLKIDFEVKDLGNINYCLGIEFQQNADNITMSQRGYIQDILQRFGMESCKAVSTPLDPGSKLTKCETLENDMKNIPYRELVGSLMYLAVATRPDIAHTVSVLSQFNACPGILHWKAAKRVLRYLKGTANLGIQYEKTKNGLTGYVDADWGGCPIDRRSYTGYAFVLSAGAISWESRKQRTVALSSTEAEYMGLTEVAKEAIYLRNFLLELGYENLSKIILHCDNQGALLLTENPVFHARTKHIDIRHHFIREVIQWKTFDVKYMPTDKMPADALTKGVTKIKLESCIYNLGLRLIQEI